MIRRLIIDAPIRMSANVTICAQVKPIDNAFVYQIAGIQRQSDVILLVWVKDLYAPGV
jgi:hypothetical protein